VRLVAVKAGERTSMNVLSRWMEEMLIKAVASFTFRTPALT
jgi:hypothetical protein